MRNEIPLPTISPNLPNDLTHLQFVRTRSTAAILHRDVERQRRFTKSLPDLRESRQ
jgi:hypothetical protein